MGMFSSFQSIVLALLSLAALGCQGFALIDALRHPEGAFVAAGKRTRTFWLVLLGVCLAVGFVVFPNILNLFGLLAFVGAAVYLADVRPALRQVRGIGNRSKGEW